MISADLQRILIGYNSDLEVVFANREEDKLFTLSVDCVVVKETDTAPFRHRIVLHTKEEIDAIDDGECSID